MHVVIAWILSFMFSNVDLTQRSDYPEAQEEMAQTQTRYESIAQDLAAVAYDPDESPLFPGNNGRLETAALLASIALYEGGFRRDVDLGLGDHARGDHGASVCLMQINVGNRKTVDGYTMKDLLADRRKCFRAGLHMAAYSFHQCAFRPVDERLRLYASGRCDRGLTESRLRVMTGVRWFEDHRPEFSDTDILQDASARAEVLIKD